MGGGQESRETNPWDVRRCHDKLLYFLTEKYDLSASLRITLVKLCHSLFFVVQTLFLWALVLPIPGKWFQTEHKATLQILPFPHPDQVAAQRPWAAR